MMSVTLLTVVFVHFIQFSQSQVNVNEIKLANTEKNAISSTTVSSNIQHINSMNANPSNSADNNLICPGNETAVPLFTLPCERDTDCSLLSGGLLCCARKELRFKRCLKGIPSPKPEPQHSPWLRIFPRICPEAPIAEFGEIKNCTTDADCTPRICCPEKGTSENYCRTAAIQLDNYPTVKRIMEPVTNFATYFQCTPAPSPSLDLFVKQCRSALDCLPNLCCQEKGRRVCRPPKQSLLSLFIGITRGIAASSNQMTNNVINSIRN